MRAAYSSAVVGLVLGFSVPLGLVACASDNGISTGDGGEDSGHMSTGGKHTGTGGRTSTGGSTANGGNSGTGGTTAGGMCALAVPTECDGPEDCPSGQHCCGEYNMGYDKFSCMPSCLAGAAGAGGAAGAPGMGPILFELCHPGDTCEDSTAMCLTSPYLPGSLSRCLGSMFMAQTSGNPPDKSLGNGAHELNCGSAVCGSDEECCIRQPLAPYCAPKGTKCACDFTPSTDGGTKDGGGSLKDGGGSLKDGGVADAQAPSDASSKHD